MDVKASQLPQRAFSSVAQERGYFAFAQKGGSFGGAN